jgi:ribonuclease P protein component
MGAPSEKLPRARVIRRRSTFTATRERGRRTTDRCMTLSILPHDAAASDAELAEVAFLTPKRIGSAVVRNRLRRRMREIYRRTAGIKGTHAFLVWIARPTAADLTFDDLKACMTSLLRRAGRL